VNAVSGKLLRALCSVKPNVVRVVWVDLCRSALWVRAVFDTNWFTRGGLCVVMRAGIVVLCASLLHSVSGTRATRLCEALDGAVDCAANTTSNSA